jgi:hypothetical protein
MTLASEIVGRALLRIGVSPISQEPEAADAALTLVAMNEVMHGFKARGADLTHTTLNAADTFSLPAEFEGAIADLTADHVASNYGVRHPNPNDVRRARQAIMARYHVQAALVVDEGLKVMPQQYWAGQRSIY